MSIVSDEFFDVGYGCLCKSSSNGDIHYSAGRLQPSLVPGEYFFHTSVEKNPWLIIDLGAERHVDRIKIYNREMYGDIDRNRATPLTISVSSDGENFSDLATISASFGGRLTNNPFVLCPSNSIRVRYLKLFVNNTSFFHLDYVEISTKYPKLQNGKVLNIFRHGQRLTCDYVHQANSGLYSALATALTDISELHNLGYDIRTIDMGMSFVNFKTKYADDIYTRYFKKKSFEPFSRSGVASFYWGSSYEQYQRLDLKALNWLSNNFFEPSEEFLARVQQLREQLGFYAQNTIAIVYRGTDKGTELKLAAPEDYIKIARYLIDSDPKLNVVVQTDQAAARSEIQEAFGDRCRFFEQLPVSNGDQAIHLDFDKVATDLTGSKDNWTMNMMAATYLLSSSKYIVTHTGNVSFWMCIYRGNADGVYQFDRNGVLIEPRLPES